MSRPSKDPTEVAKLLTAAKGRETPWRVIEAETGVIKSTREGWFRRGSPEPPLGPLVFLADYLGVAPQDLVAAALADYAATARSAGTDQLDREARALRRELDALGGGAPDEDDSPSDEDEPQSDQAG